MPTPRKGSNWGILGGRFDPVHFGHLTLAAEVRRIQKLDGILLIPSHSHPMRNTQAGASFDDRVEMLRLAVVPYGFMEVSEIESELDLSGFTLDTVRAVKERYPGVTFFFIIGADNLPQLKKWHQPEAIVRETKLIAGARPDHRLLDLDWLPPDRVIRVESALVPVSSTMVRDRLAAAEDCEALVDLLPADVIEYIKQRRLYR